MIIRVVKRSNPYVMIDKTALEDPRLSFRAKGLHAYLLSRPDSWTPNRRQLATVSKEGERAMAAALKELQTAGYLVRERKRDEKTQRFHWVAVVYEISQKPSPGSQVMEGAMVRFPHNGFPHNGNLHTGDLISKEVKNKENEQPGSAQPTGRQAVKFPKEDYEFVLDAYQGIKGITLQGPEFSPRQQDIKSMFMAGHKREAIVACMWALEKSKEEWTVNWTLGTVRMKLPEFVAGKLFGGDGRDKDRIRALKEDIAEIDHYLEYQIEGRLTKLEWKDGDLTLEEQEEKERLERIRMEKRTERAALAKQLEVAR